MRALTLMPALFLSGCGAAAQIIYGSQVIEKRERSVTQEVTIHAEPNGAEIARRSEQKSEKLGVSPLVDRVDYRMEDTVESKAYGVLLIGSLVDLGLSIGFAAPCASKVDETGGFIEEGHGVHLICIAAALMAVWTVSEWGWGLYTALFDKETVTSSRGVPSRYTYVATKTGFEDARALIEIPRDKRVDLRLSPRATPVVERTKAAVVTEPSKKVDTTGFVIAVMSVEDANAKQADVALDENLLFNLTDQLRVFVAEAGVKTIDKGAQETALRSTITEMKANSFNACYDDACQIELGKALAASHILRSRVTRFGSQCVLNSELIDLKAEVTITAASSTGGRCAPEGFLNMTRDVARRMFAR